jgi:hypothetical protein
VRLHLPSAPVASDGIRYATGKAHLCEQLDALLGREAIRVEVTDLTDLTTDDLHGVVPEADAAPAAPDTAAPKATHFNPAAQKGSLAGLMATSLGHKPSGRKVLRSPDAAHGV